MCFEVCIITRGVCQTGLFLKQISIVNKHSVFTLIVKLNLGVTSKTTESRQLEFYFGGWDRVGLYRHFIMVWEMPISFLLYIPTE